MDYETFKRAATRSEDVIVQCPYNKSHLINKSRMQYHLMKCEKQYAMKELEICPYNATHRIPKPLLQHHLRECTDRRILEAAKYQTEDDVSRNSGLSAFQPPTLPPSEENWDDEEVQATYEPGKHVSNKCIFRSIQGATKSQRKEFYLEERKRVADIISGNDKTAALPANFPLRLPKSLPKAMMDIPMDKRLGMGRGIPSNVMKGPSKLECKVVETERKPGMPASFSQKDHGVGKGGAKGGAF